MVVRRRRSTRLRRRTTVRKTVRHRDSRGLRRKYAGSKRNRSRSRVRRNVRRSVNVSDRGTEINPAGVTTTFNKYTVRATRTRPNSTRYLNKLVKANENKEIWRWSNLRNFENISVVPSNNVATEVGGGAYWLYNYNNGLAGGNVHYLPLNMFDVTSLVNPINGTSVSVNPSWRLRINNSNTAAAPMWMQLTNQDESGNDLAGNSSWRVVDSSQTSQVGTGPKRRCMLDWVRAKMVLYGAYNQVTKFKIMFVQLKEDWLHPDFVYDAPGLPNNLSNPYAQQAAQFWRAFTASFSQHPANSVVGYNPKYMKIIKQFNFVLQQNNSTDTYQGSIGHNKVMDIFMPLNRVCKYDWLRNTSAGITDYKAAGYDHYNGNLSTTVHPKARIYMIVMASNWVFVDAQSGGVPQVSNTPSFDLNLTKRITLLDG